jgi:hypothetical protein
VQRLSTAAIRQFHSKPCQGILSAIGIFRQSGAVIALPECPENKQKKCGQWQATNNRHQTCDDGMPLYASPHEINDGAD